MRGVMQHLLTEFSRTVGRTRSSLKAFLFALGQTCTVFCYLKLANVSPFLVYCYYSNLIVLGNLQHQQTKRTLILSKVPLLMVLSDHFRIGSFSKSLTEELSTLNLEQKGLGK